jgi:hypothetical protein
VSFSKSGQRLYSVGNDGHVCEMDSTSGQVLAKFRAAKTPLSCVAVAEGQWSFSFVFDRIWFDRSCRSIFLFWTDVASNGTVV